jgi:ribonuclease-3 family protein
VSEYIQSTGLEALVGYLYCKGEEERLNQLMKKTIALVEKEIEAYE